MNALTRVSISFSAAREHKVRNNDFKFAFFIRQPTFFRTKTLTNCFFFFEFFIGQNCLSVCNFQLWSVTTTLRMQSMTTKRCQHSFLVWFHSLGRIIFFSNWASLQSLGIFTKQPSPAPHQVWTVDGNHALWLCWMAWGMLVRVEIKTGQFSGCRCSVPGKEKRRDSCFSYISLTCSLVFLFPFAESQ